MRVEIILLIRGMFMAIKRKTNKEDIKKIVQGKRVPILTLDEKWHALFYNYEKSSSIKDLEMKLNNLLKKQGKLVHDIKGMRALKPKLMNGIIQNMNPDETKDGLKKNKILDKNQKLIKELGGKLSNAEDELLEIPYDIKSVNEELMVESAKVCYKRINDNSEKIKSYDTWINETKAILKQRILEKQELEESNTMIYSYLHDLLGAEMLEILDKKSDY